MSDPGNSPPREEFYCFVFQASWLTSKGRLEVGTADVSRTYNAASLWSLQTVKIVNEQSKMVPYTASDIKKDSADSPWLFWALPAASARALSRIVLFIAMREQYIRRGLQGPSYKYSYPLYLGHIVRTPSDSFPLLYNFVLGWRSAAHQKMRLSTVMIAIYKK
jgi:hypothetical protein